MQTADVIAVPLDTRGNSLQAQKARATRDRIIHAVVSIIRESGLRAASASAITARAGITWGAVQHHFGGKNEILQAILERAYRVYLERINSPALHRGNLTTRIDCYIDAIWAHYRSDLYFAFQEILMAHRDSDMALDLHNFRPAEASALSLEWLQDFFHKNEQSHQTISQAIRFAHRFLAGFAVDCTLEPKMPFEQEHLASLKGLLRTQLVEQSNQIEIPN
jgi:AcrR family transcriptional regulator